MEEGEVLAEYNPALEWPGESEFVPPDNAYGDKGPPKINNAGRGILRLLVVQTSILPREQTLVDPVEYTEFQLGRDIPPSGSRIPRLRLKEMEVSKLHATVYWDKKLRAWGVVDHGSMHGTFIKSDAGGSSAVPQSEQKGVRLSASRAASIPRTLRHLDLLSIGSTTFLIHMHASQLTCDECSTGSAGEVPFSTASELRHNSSKRSREVAGLDRLPQVDHRKTLKMLKQNLISKRSPNAIDSSTINTNRPDRSTLYHIHQSESSDDIIQHVGPSSRTQTLFTAPRPHKPHPDRASDMYMPPVYVSAPPTALAETNVGHRLLLKQGWQPGETLGQMGDFSAGVADSRTSLLEPIHVSANIGKAGIGMSAAPASLPVDDYTVKKRAL